VEYLPVIMNEIYDNKIRGLYYLAQQEDAAAVIPDQKLAIEQLKELALMGNADAETALNRMKHLPFLHPLLKELLTA